MNQGDNVLFYWKMEDAHTLIHCCETQMLLHRDAILTVGDNQWVYVAAGGRSMMLVEADTYVIGNGDGRKLDEIALALRNGEKGHVNIAPEIIFFDMRGHRCPEERMSIDIPDIKGGNAQATVYMSYDLFVMPDYVLNRPFDRHGDIGEKSPFIHDTRTTINRQIRETLKRKLTELLTGLDSSQMNVIFANAKEKITQEIQQEIRAYLDQGQTLGFDIDRLTIRGGVSGANRCPVCGLEVQRGKDRCRMGHLQTWCPECMEQVPSSAMKCRNGHILLWCQTCESFVKTEKKRFCVKCGGACYPKITF